MNFSMNQELPHFFREKFPLLGDLPFFNRRALTATTAFLAGLAVLAYSLQSGPKAPAFAHAERMFAKWAASPQDEALFQEMTQALKKVPALQQKYEAILAQKLLEGGKGAEALRLAYHSLELAKEETPFHAAYAATSLLIEQGEYQTSLQQAVALKEQMARECDVARFAKDPMVGGSLLYAHNLLRIACLQQELGNRPGEKAAWEELEAFLNLKEDSPLSQYVLSGFHENGIDLSHYIAERKSALD